MVTAFLAGDLTWIKGCGFFPDRDNFTGKDLCDTTRALDCLLTKKRYLKRFAAFSSNPFTTSMGTGVLESWTCTAMWSQRGW